MSGKRIDYLRLATIVLFVVLLSRTIFSLTHKLHYLLVLQGVYELGVIFLCLIQLRARKLDMSPTAFIFVGVHLILPMLYSTEGAISPLGIYPLLFVIAGFAFSIFSLLDLSAYFGVLPAFRGVRSTGMYRYLRHPAYAGYVISSLGVCMSLFSERNVLIFLCYVLFTVLRINLEESLLSSSSDEYITYKSRVRYRLVPGVY